jgi:hypothetical protein
MDDRGQPAPPTFLMRRGIEDVSAKGRVGQGFGRLCYRGDISLIAIAKRTIPHSEVAPHPSEKQRQSDQTH